MLVESRLNLRDIEQRVCDIASEQLGIRRNEVSSDSRIVQDLNCDSLDLVELFMVIEDKFDLSLPNDSPNSVYKAVFARRQFRLSDLAELVYFQQGTGKPERVGWWRTRIYSPPKSSVLFTQLGGTWSGLRSGQPMFEPLETDGSVIQFRRASDGMRCILIPAATVEIGCNLAEAPSDEQPMHLVMIDSFLIDVEPVSTTAYCRFLNSVGETDPQTLIDWFVLEENDDRTEHMLIEWQHGKWQPVAGTELWPMILVSWFGANAYSQWANGGNWSSYTETSSFLPTEAQWEYAARGGRFQKYPWGDGEPTPDKLRFGQHSFAETYEADSLPMADVNEPLGMSPFGLHHMAGNVWQWCRDWYEGDFYKTPEANRQNPVNCRPTEVRSERGGSWVGPAQLCRSSFRRGRDPYARGRCLGFRCISPVPG